MKKILKILFFAVIIAGLAYFAFPFKAATLQYPDKSIRYQGDLVNNQPQGVGKYYSEKGKLIYDGQWAGGKRNGSGKEYSENGKVAFQGSWKNDLKSGVGKEYHKDGTLQYEGGFSEGMYSGTGKYYGSNGNLTYEGTWDHGLKQGEGKAYTLDGKLLYSGNFIQGVFEKELPSFQPNILNYGTLNQTGDWLYYHTLKDGKFQLIKANSCTGDSMIINSDTSAFYINVSKDWVYYTDSKSKIHRSKTDGSQITEAIGGDGGEYAKFMLIRDNFIYFVGDNSMIFKMTLDGQSKTVIGKDKIFVTPISKDLHVGWFILEGDMIYYVNSVDRLLYKIKTDGSEKTKVLSEKVELANIQNGVLYYISESDFNIYSYSLTETGVKPKRISNLGATNQGIINMIVSGDAIYYLDFGSKDKKNLIKITIANPSEKKVLADDVNGAFFCISNDDLYYVSVNGSIYRVRADGSGQKELV